MHHSNPKKYPKKPEELWQRRDKPMSPKKLLAALVGLASNAEQVIAQVKAKKKASNRKAP